MYGFLGIGTDEFPIFGIETETHNGGKCASIGSNYTAISFAPLSAGATLSLVTYLFNDNLIFFNSMDAVILVAV